MNKCSHVQVCYSGVRVFRPKQLVVFGAAAHEQQRFSALAQHAHCGGGSPHGMKTHSALFADHALVFLFISS